MVSVFWRRVGMVALSASLTFVLIGGGWVSGIQSSVSASPGPLIPLVFQLNFTAGGYNAGFAVALQKGYYRREGLDVTISKGQGSATTAELVASGKADIAYADALPVMQIIAKGAPMKVVSTIYQSNPNAVTVLATSGIKSFKDLKGKSLAVPAGGSQTAMIPILLKANGLSESDVKLVNMPGTAMTASLLQHQVDAMLGSLDSYDLELKARRVPILEFPFANYGVATVSTSIIASNSYLASHGDIVTRFIKASLDGWNDTIKDNQTGIDALQQTFPTDAEPTRNMGELKAAISLMCSNGAKYVGKAEPQAWTYTVNVAQQVLGLPTSVPASAYYTYNYLPPTFPTKCPIK